MKLVVLLNWVMLGILQLWRLLSRIKNQVKIVMREKIVCFIKINRLVIFNKVLIKNLLLRFIKVGVVIKVNLLMGLDMGLGSFFMRMGVHIKEIGN